MPMVCASRLVGVAVVRRQKLALVSGTNWCLAPTASKRQLKSALVGWCVPSIRQLITQKYIIM